MSKFHLYTIYFFIVLLLGAIIHLWSSKEPTFNPGKEGRKGENKSFFRAAESSYPGVKIFTVPEDLSFAGEPVPLRQPDILERYEREIYVNAYWHSNTVLLMKRAGKFLPVIEKILNQNGIPDDFKYVSLIESGLMNVVSPAGARGFWQFMESTAKERGLEVNAEVDERYHFEKSTRAACDYLKHAYARFGNWTSVAASYNMGVSGLGRRKTEQKMPGYYDLLLNEETSRYLFRVLAIKEIFENPKEYGFELQEDDLYKMPLMRELIVAESIPNLADWAIRHNSNYKELKIYNPWLRSTKLTVRKGNSYKINLPA